MTLLHDQDGIQLFHGRAEDVDSVIPPSDVDLLLTDPPWGISHQTDSTRFSGGWMEKERSRGSGRKYAPIEGDDQPFDPSQWLRYRRVVLWGANHFAATLPPGTWLVWLKKHDHLFGAFLSDAELAWQQGGAGVYVHRRPFSPPSRIAETGSCLHPTQKPLSLMRWCIERSGIPAGSMVLDPFAGSGTTLVAARDMGMRAIGIECNAEYAKVAAIRLHQQQLPFKAPPFKDPTHHARQ